MQPNTTATPTDAIQMTTGWLLIAMLTLALTAALTHRIPGYVAGIPIWVAALMMISHLTKKQRIQSGSLFVVGALGLAVGAYHDADPGYLLKAVEANQLLVAMIVSVSFLRIVATQNVRSEEQLPTGKRAMILTLLGCHLISSVINMSSVMIMGDRLNDKKSLTPIQAVTLLRAFSIAALWSPFFAAMGVILISAPGAQLGTLILFGLPTTAAALLMTAWQFSRSSDIESTPGYPMHLRALWMPILLAILVIAGHSLWPDLSVITLVTVTSIMFVLLYLPITRGKQSLQILGQHIGEGLPKLGGEITLFLSAAVLAAGIAALLTSFDIRIAPDHFGALEASVTLLVVVGLAMIGMHPVTTAILAGSILMPSVGDPNLLGITLLLGWTIGVGVSPFSAVQLNVQSRYRISALALVKLNLFYTPAVLLIGVAVIWSYARFAAL